MNAGRAADDLRVLIVGGGIAGLTLAALLRRHGLSPVVIDRSDLAGEEGGYMLGLYYLGSRVLHGLGLFEEFRTRSSEMRRYEIRDGHGDLVHDYDLEEMTRRVGPLRGITRPALVRLLREGVDDLPIRTNTTVEHLEDDANEVRVKLSDGSVERFDLVVGADGLHSTTRETILDEDEYEYWDTGWAGWVCWAEEGSAPPDTYTECWGPGRFVGLYPVKGRVGVFFGGPAEHVEAAGPEAVLAELRTEIRPETRPVGPVVSNLNVPGDAFFWRFHDCRASVWRKGRVVLLGDAATGFLPTAGIGASMAMESAAALADELSRTDGGWIERSLDLYELRHRRRVEKAQENSRELGRMMFVESTALAWGRDQLVKRYSLERLIKSIASMMDEPI